MFVKLFLMFLSLMVLLGWILYARLVSPLKLRMKWRIILGLVDLAIVLGAGSALPMTIMASRDGTAFERYHLAIFLPVGFYFVTFVCLILGFVILKDAVYFVSRLVKFIRERISGKQDEPQTEEEEAALESRRRFIRCAASVATLGGAALMTPCAIYHARERRIVKEIDIALKSIPEGLDGFRIVHLSDIHVGNTIRREDIEAIVSETNALNPDLIVITGDMADGFPSQIGDWLDPMRKFVSKYGTYFVTGNHDHMWDGEGWCQCVEKLGIKVLNNTHEILDTGKERLAVAGVIDANGDRRKRRWRSDPSAALDSVPEGIFRLMLAHQPKSVDASFKSGADLVLVGHTHGGQFWPLTYVVEALHKYSKGLYHVGEKAVFVSCGTGYWGPPLRFGVPPEIDVLTLRHQA